MHEKKTLDCLDYGIFERIIEESDLIVLPTVAMLGIEACGC